MTTEERMKRKKELLFAKDQLTNEIALHRDDARKAGEFLVKVGNLLISRPEGFFIAHDSALCGTDVRDVTDINEIDAKNALSYDSAIKVTNEIRRCIQELERTEGILQTF